jgi:hypothetical protein
LASLVNRLAPAVDDAVNLQVLEDLLQPDAVVALDSEALRDLPLADLALSMGDEGDDLLPAGKVSGLVGFGTFGQGESSLGLQDLLARKRGCG